MQRSLNNLQSHIPLVVFRSRAGGLLRIFFYALSTLCATCEAATYSSEERLPLRQLTEVWRDAFPLANVGMAPSTFPRTFPAGKPAPKAGVRLRSDRPHPAVARIVVPEQGATAYGSGTLIDVRDNFGLVITNWHVVRDATGTIEVVFPGGFTSKARALKVDADWDLAALVIWQPPIEPVSIAEKAPQPGDQLTICGYGQGNYRCATGRCTQYYAPRLDFPRHMVELDVEARQGDSGGPIFNEGGELAGVLFGAGQGTTLGSFGGRVGAFLATLAPDIGRATESLAASRASCPSDDVEGQPAWQAATLRPRLGAEKSRTFASSESIGAQAADWPSGSGSASTESGASPNRATEAFGQAGPVTQQASSEWRNVSGRGNFFEQMKTALAAIGLLALVIQVLRVAR